MDLESILRKAWAETDQEILRFYTKMGENIPDENLYKTATKWLLGTKILEVACIGAFLGAYGYYGSSLPEAISHASSSSRSLVEIAENIQKSVSMGISATSFGYDLLYNWLGLLGAFPIGQTDVQSNGSYLKESFQKASRKLRLPVVACSLYQVGKVCFDVSQPIEGDKFFEYIISEGVHAIALFGLATSMYLKERDPKLLNKDPFWKRAYDYASGKVQEMFPTPVPAPVRTYSALEISAS